MFLSKRAKPANQKKKKKNPLKTLWKVVWRFIKNLGKEVDPKMAEE